MSSSDKLPLAQTLLTMIAARLHERDRVSIVTYAGSDRVALEPTLAGERRTIREAIARLSSGGSTNGEGGIRRAYAEAARHHEQGTVSRVIICTDGDFNVGISDAEQLKALMLEKAKTGIFCNVFGFGQGNYQDATAKAISANGNGTYTYIDSEATAERLADSELRRHLVTVAQDAKCQVFFNPAEAAAWRLIGYDYRILAREDFNNDAKDAGDVGAGHQVTVLYQVIPAGGSVPGGSDPNPFIIPDDRDAAPASRTVTPRPIAQGTLLRARLRWQPPGGGTSILRVLHYPPIPPDADPNAVGGAEPDGARGPL